MNSEEPRTIKVLGGRNLPPYWERFDQLQRTAHKLRATAGLPRGIFRFADFAAFEEWQWNQRLNRPDRPSEPTS